MLFGAAAHAAEEPKVPQTLETFLQKLGYGSIPLERAKGNDLFVRGEINGKERTLVIDTGCAVTQLDSKVAGKMKTPAELGVRVIDEALGEQEGGELVIIETLKLGKALFKNQVASKLPLRSISQSYDGLLGCDFFIRNHAIIDCAAKRMYVRGQPLESEMEPVLLKTLQQSGYHRAKLMKSDSLVPIRRALLDQVSVVVMIDTGSTFSLLDMETVRSARLPVRRTGTGVMGLRRGMKSELGSVSIKRLELEGGAMPLKGLMIGVADLRGWQLGKTSKRSVPIEGLIGGELLAQSGSVIDFGGYSLWFVPEEK